MLTGPPETQAFKTVRTVLSSLASVHPQPAGAGTGSGVPVPAGWGSSPSVHFHCLLSPLPATSWSFLTGTCLKGFLLQPTLLIDATIFIKSYFLRVLCVKTPCGIVGFKEMGFGLRLIWV